MYRSLMLLEVLATMRYIKLSAVYLRQDLLTIGVNVVSNAWCSRTAYSSNMSSSSETLTFVRSIFHNVWTEGNQPESFCLIFNNDKSSCFLSPGGATLGLAEASLLYVIGVFRFPCSYQCPTPIFKCENSITSRIRAICKHGN